MALYNQLGLSTSFPAGVVNWTLAFEVSNTGRINLKYPRDFIF